MTAPFQALLRHGFARDASGLPAFALLVRAHVQRAAAQERDDLAQTVLLKLAATPEKSVLLVSSLARRNPGLAAALDATPPGAVPAIPEAALAEADRQLQAYLAEMIRNAERDRLRRERRTAPLVEPDRFPSSAVQRDDEGDVLGLRDRVLAEIGQRAPGNGALGEAIEEIQALAEGRTTMDALTSACVAADPALRALPPEAARIRARNRLQQRHKRAREQLLVAIRSLVAAGKLTPDEGREAETWLGMLMRRQNRTEGASA